MQRLHTAVIASALCVACGARTSLSDEAPEAADGAAATDAASDVVALSIPLGVYDDCVSSTITTRPNFVGGTGRGGAVTLSQEGDTVVAALDFPTYASGRLAFAPTTERSAGFRAAQRFDVQTANEGFRVVTVTASSGVLSLVGQTLFVSTRGGVGGDAVSTFVHCRVPATLPLARVVTSAPPPGAPSAGVYRACATAFSTDGPVHTGLSGGSGALTVAADAGALRVSWTDSLLSELSCSAFDFGAPSVAAPLTAGQTCVVRSPCGPPPTLGPSPFPSTAPWHDLRGSMLANGGVLFVDVVGDTSTAACGVHDLSITCADR